MPVALSPPTVPVAITVTVAISLAVPIALAVSFAFPVAVAVPVPVTPAASATERRRGMRVVEIVTATAVLIVRGPFVPAVKTTITTRVFARIAPLTLCLQVDRGRGRRGRRLASSSRGRALLLHILQQLLARLLLGLAALLAQ